MRASVLPETLMRISGIIVQILISNTQRIIKNNKDLGMMPPELHMSVRYTHII
jgi:hypothetical protein